MAEITASMVKELREKTDAPMMECKKALTEAAGDLTKAEELLRVRLGNKASKAAGRVAAEGVVAVFIAPDAKLGAIIEVNCETDFVARTEDFQQLVKDIAMQVAAANPSYVAREEVPGAVVEKEREIYRQQMADQKKPPQVIDKIIEGKLEKFYAESCLLEQPFIRDASGKTRLKDMVDQATSKMGERIVVKRFARFQVGES